jgi:hypothetical protein
MAGTVSSLWKDSYYVRIYQLAKDGLTDKQIAKTLGIAPKTFVLWKQKKPAIGKALAEARTPDSRGSETFQAYVYKRLTPEMRDAWNAIVAADKEPNGMKRIETLLANRGTRFRQHLWVHALLCSNFNASEACRQVVVDYTQYKRWLNNDPEFAALIDEILWHRKNYGEGSLFKLMKQGNAAAILFFNETINSDRGYVRPRAALKLEGTVEHKHEVEGSIKLEDLSLPAAVMAGLLEAMRARGANVIDVPAPPKQLEAHNGEEETAA